MFKALAGGTGVGVLLRHDELASEGELTIACDVEAEERTRQAFCKEVRDHLEAQGRNVRWESVSGVALVPHSSVFLCT